MLSAEYYSHQAGRRAALVQRYIQLFAIGSGLVLWTGFLSYPLRAQTYTIAQKIAVPSYFVPGPFWTQLNQSSPYVGIAVANVVNGPDYLANPDGKDYKSAIQASSAAGIKVLGYVRTGYFGTTGFTTRLGQSDIASWLAQIEQDVNAWYSFYGSDGLAGIFFDEAQNACGYAKWYSFISAYVKQNHPGALVAENPGTAVPSCFQGTADIILTFEGTYLCYVQDALRCPAGQQYTSLAWNNPVDPRSIWHLVYETSSDKFANASALAKARSAGWFYITSDTLPNPWDSLPSSDDWSVEEAATSPTGGDVIPPSSPSGLTAPSSGLGYTSAVLNWNASTDSGSGVVGYDVFQNGVWILSTPANTASTPTVTLTGLLPNTPYSFTLQARDASGNVSGPSDAYSLTTHASNGVLPTAPGNLTTSSITYSSVTLSWTGSTDSLGISAYDVYKGGTKILTVDGSTTSVLVGGLSPATQSTFIVTARDPQGNVSAASNSANTTTLTLPAGGAISNPTGKVNPVWLTYSADFNLAFGFDHVFIDSDSNPGTGWFTASTPSLGADYLIENDTLYQYVGSGTDWAWKLVDTISPKFKDYTVSWKVPVSDFANPATTQSVVFSGNGFAPTAYSRVITLN
jgi:chitodextrinase